MDQTRLQYLAMSAVRNAARDTVIRQRDGTFVEKEIPVPQNEIEELITDGVAKEAKQQYGTAGPGLQQLRQQLEALDIDILIPTAKNMYLQGKEEYEVTQMSYFLTLGKKVALTNDLHRHVVVLGPQTKFVKFEKQPRNPVLLNGEIQLKVANHVLRFEAPLHNRYKNGHCANTCIVNSLTAMRRKKYFRYLKELTRGAQHPIDEVSDNIYNCGEVNMVMEQLRTLMALLHTAEILRTDEDDWVPSWYTRRFVLQDLFCKLKVCRKCQNSYPVPSGCQLSLQEFQSIFLKKVKGLEDCYMCGGQGCVQTQYHHARYGIFTKTLRPQDGHDGILLKDLFKVLPRVITHDDVAYTMEVIGLIEWYKPKKREVEIDSHAYVAEPKQGEDDFDKVCDGAPLVWAEDLTEEMMEDENIRAQFCIYLRDRAAP